MKKAYLVLTLILSSFFIFNLDVKADEVTYNVDFDFLADDFLLYKQAVDNFILEDSSLGSDYIIYLEITNAGTSVSKTYYRVLFCGQDDVQVNYWKENLIFYSNNTLNQKTFTDYVLDAKTFSFNSGSKVLIEKSSYCIYNILYSTFDIKTRSDNQVVNFVSGDYIKTFSVDGNDFYPTFYDMYLEKNGELVSPDPHKEEKETLGSFYILCINKLAYLGEVIVSNYIYLSMIVILMLVFVFLLVFRRLL